MCLKQSGGASLYNQNQQDKITLDKRHKRKRERRCLGNLGTGWDREIDVNGGGKKKKRSLSGFMAF